ncbi:hypothetical protein NSK_007454 [Nannochloropsis salina CCMP1776]|uniref:RRM Nup35-type domain-containing protein n=1 Tax=Nannochloropsis salina CCMP1776 TaxID=1027361 RepID=A0A4D9CT89_9STRA|nr:hypothetical protein NSK_007454 [Nannochloropsis salina CCMP1776]|eukprot:TFJ81237.1 hypothetical protein NSK_007454 [Nannochloropsis salina CCMP1776]
MSMLLTWALAAQVSEVVTMEAFTDSLLWEYPQHGRLRLNAVIFFLAFLVSAGIGLSAKLKSSDYVPLVLTSRGRPLFVIRLFEWMVTVPMLLSLIGLLPYSPPRGVSSSSVSTGLAAAHIGTAAAGSGQKGGKGSRRTSFEEAPPTESLTDLLDDPDPGRNSRLAVPARTKPAPLATLRDPDQDASRWGAAVGQSAWACWVLVFGFPRELRETVLGRFALYGSIKASRAEGNWLLLEYATRAEAEKAAAQNGSLLQTGGVPSRAAAGLVLGAQRVTPEVVRRLGLAMRLEGEVELLSRPNRGRGSLQASYELAEGEAVLRHRRSLTGRGKGDLQHQKSNLEGSLINDSDLLKSPAVERSVWFMLWIFVCRLLGWR